MPNWCSNYIQISGEKPNIDKIKVVLYRLRDSKGEENDRVFQSLIGLPSDVDYEKDWYNTNVEWFGTKWDTNYDSCQFDFTDDTITMSPDTAWSPPVNFCKQLAIQYGVYVNMKYEEPGSDYAGLTEITPEGDVYEEDYTYNEGIYVLQSDWFWEKLTDDFEYTSETLLDELDEDSPITIEVVTTFLTNEYSYVSSKHLVEITELFVEYLKENYTERTEELQLV